MLRALAVSAVVLGLSCWRSLPFASAASGSMRLRII